MDYNNISHALSQSTTLEFLVFDQTHRCLHSSPNVSSLMMKHVDSLLNDFIALGRPAMMTQIAYGTLAIIKDRSDNCVAIIFQQEGNETFSSPSRMMTTLQLVYTMINETPLYSKDVYLPEYSPLEIEDYNKKTQKLLLESRIYNLNQDYLNELRTLEYVREVRFDKIKESFSMLKESNTESIVQDSVLDITIKTICMSTLLARIAIEEHVPVANAFSLSDAIIRTALMQTTQTDAASYFEASLIHFAELIAKYKYNNYSPHVQRVITYINSHLYEPIRLEDIAKNLHYSTWYISRAFKQDAGLSINEMIHYLKTNEAKILLRFSHMSSQEIAVQLGYSQHSHFIERFKRIENCTPDRYRKMAGQREISNLSNFIETL